MHRTWLAAGCGYKRGQIPEPRMGGRPMSRVPSGATARRAAAGTAGSKEEGDDWLA